MASCWVFMGVYMILVLILPSTLMPPLNKKKRMSGENHTLNRLSLKKNYDH